MPTSQDPEAILQHAGRIARELRVFSKECQRALPKDHPTHLTLKALTAGMEIVETTLREDGDLWKAGSE